jgi:hypothetical protein
MLHTVKKDLKCTPSVHFFVTDDFLLFELCLTICLIQKK